MVMLRRWSIQWRENGLTEVVSLMEGEWSRYGGGQVEGEWSCYRGCHFNRGRMVMLQR